jgi:RNA 2',3'-cyclic 3'-phosphodiesterase
MQTKRTFIAIDIQPDLKLTGLVNKLKNDFSGEEVKWGDPGNMHLTLRFLGNTTDSQLLQISKELEILATDFPCFDLKIKGLGLFVKNGNPQVLWAGVELPEFISTMVAKIEEIVVNAGFEREQKKFKPHLTLCRIKSFQNKEKLKAKVGGEQGTLFSEQAVNEVTFYESILLPKGPEYRPIKSFNLMIV